MGGELMMQERVDGTEVADLSFEQPQGSKDRQALRTTVIGSYPFPGWLEFATTHMDEFGEVDVKEMRRDAVIAAVHDQVRAGLDVITDGEQTRYDFNLSFYGRLDGIGRTPFSPRRFGPPGHDQRGRYPITSTIASVHSFLAPGYIRRTSHGTFVLRLNQLAFYTRNRPWNHFPEMT